MEKCGRETALSQHHWDYAEYVCSSWWQAVFLFTTPLPPFPTEGDIVELFLSKNKENNCKRKETVLFDKTLILASNFLLGTLII